MFGIDFPITFVIHVGIGCGAGWATRFRGRPAVLFGLENATEVGWRDATTLTALVSVVWNWVQASEAYVAEAGSWLGSHLGIGQLVNQGWSTLKTVASAMEWAWDQLVTYIYTLVKAALAAVIDPIVNAAQSFDSTLGAAANATVTDVSSGGNVTPAHAMAWARAFDPIAYMGPGLPLPSPSSWH